MTLKTKFALVWLAVVIALICGATSAAAIKSPKAIVTYYVSEAGNTTNSGTNPNATWNLAKANSSFNLLNAGDSILFKRGDEFFGTITINKSGTVALPIVIGAYGTGAKPIITGFYNIPSWTHVTGNIWESSAITTSKTSVRVFVLGNVLQRYGRYPNTTFLSISSHNSTISITDNEFSTNAITDLNLGQLVMRTSQWTLDHAEITSHSGTTISYAQNEIEYTPKDGWGYFLQNYPSAVDVVGEYYYDPTTKKIRVYHTSSTIAPVGGRVATIDNLLYGNGFDNIIIDNISFQGAHSDAINLVNNSDRITIQYCDIGFVGIEGIEIDGTTFDDVDGNSTTDPAVRSTIQYCSIQNCLNRWVMTQGANVSNNTMYNSSHIQGMNQNGSGQVSLHNRGDNTITEYNTVKNTGYGSIWHGFKNARTRYNVIDSFCLNRNDAGGIYTQNASDHAQSNSWITKNIIKHTGDSRPGSIGWNKSFGIYLDDRTTNVLVDSNVLVDGQSGAYFHGNRNITIVDNLFYANTYSQLWFGNDLPSGLPMTGMTILRNKMIARTADQMIERWVRKSSDPIASFGTMNNNWITRPIQETGGISGSAPIVKIEGGGTTTLTYNTLAQWKAANGGIYDQASQRYANSPIANVNLFLYIENTTKVNKTITLVNNYVDVTGAVYPCGTVVLQPFTAKVLIQTSSCTGKLTPTITWNAPAAITYGTALSSTQLNATASVPGTLNYTPVSGTILNAGTQTLNVSFVPDDQATYNSVNKFVLIVVNKATATLSLSGLTQTYSGSPRSVTVTTNPTGLTGVSTTYNGIGTAPTNAGSYPVVSGLNNTNYTATSVSGTLVISKATATFNISNLAQTYNASPRPVTVTTNPAGLTGVAITYNGSATAPTNAGSYPVAVTLTNTNYSATTANTTLVISKATPTVSWTAPAAITYPAALSGAQLNATASVAGTFTYTPASGTVLNAGTQSLSVNFVPTDAANYNNATSTTVSITVNKAAATISLSGLTQTYDGLAKPVTVTTSPVGLGTIALTYNGSSTAPTTAGSYPIIAVLTNANYTATNGTGTLVISKATAVLTLSGLAQVYNGTSRVVTVATSPVGLTTIATTYNGSVTAPTVAGSYAVVATLTHANYQGTASGTLVVSKGTPVISWAASSAITYGTALSGAQLDATANVAGTFTYSPPLGTILNAGANTLTATFTPTDAANYNSVSGLSVPQTVNKATATITLSNLAQDYDGNPKPVTVTTSPVGLGVVTVTYNGSATPPTAVGTYPVVAALSNTNYTATSATGNLVISTSVETVTITNLSQIYDGTTQPVTVTVSGGWPYSVTYNGSATVPTNAGTYTVVATINDGIHTGTATETFVINKANPVVTWANPAGITYGTALSGTQLNATASVAGVVTYVPASGTVLNAGTQVLSASFVPTDNANYNTISGKTATIVVSKAAATLTLGGLEQVYDGTAKSVTVATSPVGLSAVTVTYNGATLPPSAVGIYVVVATLTNSNYTAAQVTDNFEIVQDVQAITIEITNILQAYSGAPRPVTITTAAATYTVTYDGSATAPTAAGSYTVVATITDPAYSGQSTETLVIAKANPVITWAAPASIEYGTPLSGTQLNPSSAVPGSFSFIPISGTVLNVGTQNISVTLTPTDAANYNTVTKEVSITVTKADVVLMLSGLSQVYNGTQRQVTVQSSPSVTGVSVLYNGSATPPTNAGSYPVVVSLTNGNYQASNVTGTLVVAKASPVLSWTAPARMVEGAALSSVQLNPTASVAGTFSYPANPAGTILPVGTQHILATFTPTDSVNYSTGTVSVVVSVYGQGFLNYLHGRWLFLND